MRLAMPGGNRLIQLSCLFYLLPKALGVTMLTNNIIRALAEARSCNEAEADRLRPFGSAERRRSWDVPMLMMRPNTICCSYM